MKLAEKIVFIAFVFSLVWYLSERLLDFNVSGHIPLVFIAIFLWGVHIIIQYFAKSEMVIAAGLSVSAGELNVPSRRGGAAVGLFISLLSIYGYFAGWSG
ncbi:hypothetical protein ACVBEJ_06595 [Porticoccus sp. GXU_MW_L64]